MQNEAHRPSFAAGLATGVLVGAGLALLLAPRTGAEVRQKIGRAGRRVAETAHELSAGVQSGMHSFRQGIAASRRERSAELRAADGRSLSRLDDEQPSAPAAQH